MKRSKYKISDSELTTILGLGGQQGTDEHPKPGMMGRIFYTNLPGNTDPQSYGFITSSLVNGLNFNEVCFHAKYVSIKNILRKTCETSSAGSTGKKLVKFMESVKTDHFGMVTLNDTIVMHNTNYIKMMGGDIVRIPILSPNKQMIFYEYILPIYTSKIKYNLIYDNQTKVNDEIIFPINMYLTIGSYNSTKGTTISSEDIYTKIYAFIDEISTEYYFNLIDMTWMEYTLLTYLDPYILNKYHTDITVEMIEYILDKIKFKLYKSLSPGIAIGLEYSHNIQEKFTQQSLSAFHTTKKSGATATQVGFGEFKDTVELSKKKQDIVTAYTRYRHKLEAIKIQLEYLCLEYFNPTITELKNINEEYIISIVIDKRYINKKITCYVYYDMYKAFMEDNVLVKNYILNILFKPPNDIEVIITMKVKEPITVNKLFIYLGLKRGVCKGKFENENLEIEQVKMYDNTDGYMMSFYIDNINEFEYFDTKDVYLELGPWFTYSCLGIQFMEYAIHNRLIKTTKERSMELCYRLLSKLMCLNNTPMNIKKLRDSGPIKSAVHGIIDPLVVAAWNNIVEEKTDIYSKIFCGDVNKIGHNYNTFYYDLNVINDIKIISESTEQKSIKSRLIEEF